jgi:hypothetical protein
MALDALRGVPSRRVCLLSDCSDAVLLVQPDAVIETYESTKSPILMSAEHVSYPLRELDLKSGEEASRRLNTPFVYGNSGGVIGVAGALREFYRCALDVDASNDQTSMRRAALKLGIPRDEDCRVMYTLSRFRPGDAVIEIK